MAPVYWGQNRIPLADDAAGLCAIYGCPPVPLPTPTPTSTFTPTVTPTQTPAPYRVIVGPLTKES